MTEDELFAAYRLLDRGPFTVRATRKVRCIGDRCMTMIPIETGRVLCHYCYKTKVIEQGKYIGPRGRPSSY